MSEQMVPPPTVAEDSAKEMERLKLELEMERMRAELAAMKMAKPAAAPTAPAQQASGNNYRPNKMDNIILGSLIENEWGQMKGSFDVEAVKAAIAQAEQNSKVPGRIRFQVLRKKKDGSNTPFLTVGGAGEFGASGKGGKRGTSTRSAAPSTPGSSDEWS